MSKKARPIYPPIMEFLPVGAAPDDIRLNLKPIADVLAENGLLNSIDLLTALKDGLDPAVYVTESGEMLGHPYFWEFGLRIIARNREVDEQDAARH